MTKLFTAIGAGIAALFGSIMRIDFRGWITLAVVLLVWRIIELVAGDRALLADSSFMQLVTPICGAGGFLLIVAFAFGSNKESAEKSAALKDNAKLMNEAGIPVGGRRAEDAKPEPAAPVIVTDISPYAGKTDDDLLAELVARGEDPDKSAALTREERIKLLTDLDLAIPTEPR